MINCNKNNCTNKGWWIPILVIFNLDRSLYRTSQINVLPNVPLILCDDHKQEASPDLLLGPILSRMVESVRTDVPKFEPDPNSVQLGWQLLPPESQDENAVKPDDVVPFTRDEVTRNDGDDIKP